MAEYQNQGDAALTLAEECAEVIQVITKMKRFGGDWDEVPPGKDKTRWAMLLDEMDDVIQAWEALTKERYYELFYQCEFGSEHRHGTECTCAVDLTAADYWDGDNAHSE